MLQASERFFPRKTAPSTPALNAMHRATQRMWARLETLNEDLAQESITPADRESLVQDLSTWHKQAVSRARKQCLDAFTTEVDQATSKGNSHLARKMLQKLLPWKPQPCAQLVNADGYLMDAKEELQLMKDHARSVFQRHERLQAEITGLPSLTAPLLAKHIRSIRPHKAAPQGSASAAAWKLCSEATAEVLQQHCQELSCQAEHCPLDASVILSAQLKDTDLCFIPKPNKPPTKPANLRPLGIIRPDDKGIAGACRDKLRPLTEQYLKPAPKDFAYSLSQIAYQPR